MCFLPDPTKRRLCGVYQYVTAKEAMLNAEPVSETFVISGPICSTELCFRAGNETTVGKVNLELQLNNSGAVTMVSQLYI